MCLADRPSTYANKQSQPQIPNTCFSGERNLEYVQGRPRIAQSKKTQPYRNFIFEQAVCLQHESSVLARLLGKKGEGEWISYAELELKKGKARAAQIALHKTIPFRRAADLPPDSTVPTFT